MKSKPTIGFVITCHYSDDIRPDGQRFLDRLLTSIDRYVESNHKIYIIDNGSDKELKYTNSDKIHYTKITDQFELGLTGAWNIGLDLAAKDNCDIIIQCNDDLWFNQTINIFIDTIIESDNEDIVYCPMTNGVLTPPQLSNGPGIGTMKLNCKGWGSVPNGFFFGFTNNHYNKYKFEENKYFNVNNKHNNNDGKWGGQEGQFIESADKGLYGLLIKECFVHHDKLRSWKEGKKRDDRKSK